MTRSFRAFGCLLIVLLVAACGSTPRADLEDGWDWLIRQSVAYEQGQEFDLLTGEVVDQPELSLRSAVDDESGVDVEGEVLSDLCEDFVDVDRGQGYAVRSLLSMTALAATSALATGDYIEASREVSDMVTLNGPSSDGVPFFVDGERNPEWDAIRDERAALAEEYWQTHHPELVEVRDEIAEVDREIRESVYTDEMVRAAQALFVERCDVDVPEGFEFPSADELGITP